VTFLNQNRRFGIEKSCTSAVAMTPAGLSAKYVLMVKQDRAICDRSKCKACPDGTARSCNMWRRLHTMMGSCNLDNEFDGCQNEIICGYCNQIKILFDSNCPAVPACLSRQYLTVSYCSHTLLSKHWVLDLALTVHFSPLHACKPCQQMLNGLPGQLPDQLL